MYDVVIVGGGIAGLINAILIGRSGLSVALFEKKSYPFHRVCGEFISNEVRSFLIRNELFPVELGPVSLSKFLLTSTDGKRADLPLEMGGFGISRYAFDNYLFQEACRVRVEVFQNMSVSKISKETDTFCTTAGGKIYESKLVIGAYGKRASLDKTRDFMRKKSPYLGVKYHIRTDLPPDQIALHNFQDGYCGVSQIENNQFNLCYLSHRKNLKPYKDIDAMEKAVLHKNPFLKRIWDSSDFLFKKPLVINEISFERKELVHNQVLMCGDTAGMITPLCGNGMAIAIRSAKILSELVVEFLAETHPSRSKLEAKYTNQWNKEFAFRLAVGRNIQKLFGAKWSSNLGVRLAKVPSIGSAIVRMTHGQSF